jgi:hypothetical protein
LIWNDETLKQKAAAKAAALKEVEAMAAAPAGKAKVVLFGTGAGEEFLGASGAKGNASSTRAVSSTTCACASTSSSASAALGPSAVHSVPWDTRATTTEGPGAGTKDEASPPPPYAPQTASSDGLLYAFEVQGASRSIGGAAPVVKPRLDFVGSVLPEVDAAKFYAEFEAELDA